MKIEMVKIDSLIPAEYNPRKLSKKQFQDIKNSLAEYGIVKPIIVNKHPDRKNTIIAGHQRVKVWKSMGNTTIPATFENLSFEAEKQLNVRLNKNTGEFDDEILAEYFCIPELVEWGFNEDELFGSKKNDNDFEDEANQHDDQNCKYPIVPDFFEDHQYFVIVCGNEIDEQFIRSKFGLNKNFKSKLDSNCRKSNVMTVEMVRKALQDD